MSRTILLADDSITIQKIVNLTFSGEGIDVVTVGNGDAALKKIHEIHPSLILADIFMPGKNGYEVCEAVKNDPELQPTPVILLVGAFEPFDDHEATRVGADSHLTKPFEIKALISKVRALIEAAEQQAVASAESSLHATGTPLATEETAEPMIPSVPGEDAVDETFQMAAPEFPSPEPVVSHEEPVSKETSPPALLLEAEALGVTSEEFVGVSTPVPVEAFVETAQPVASWDTSQIEIQAMPALAIEETDPLGLESVEEAAGLASMTAGVTTDSKSLVVDIWEAAETPAVIEQVSPAVDLPPAPSLPPFEVEPEQGKGAITHTELLTEAVSELSGRLHEVVPIVPVPCVESSVSPNEVPLMEPVSASGSTSTASQEDAERAELVEMIANRVVEKLSRDVIERIAWEVVPDMAELMIKERVESHFRTDNRH